MAALGFGALTAGLIGGCGGSGSSAEQDSGPTRATTATDLLDSYTSIVEFDDVYGFTGKTLDGDRIDGANYANRTLAIWFWAPW